MSDGFNISDDRGDIRVFHPFDQSDHADASLELSHENEPEPNSEPLTTLHPLRFMLSALGCMISIPLMLLVVPAITLVLSIPVLFTLSIMPDRVGTWGIVTLVALFVAVFLATARFERAPSKQELNLRIVTDRLFAGRCGNCGTQLSNEVASTDGCTQCATCGSAWLRTCRLPVQTQNRSRREKLLSILHFRARFRIRDASASNRGLLVTRETSDLLPRLNVAWLPPSWVLSLALYALALANLVTAISRKSNLRPDHALMLFAFLAAGLAIIATRVWLARLASQRMIQAYLVSTCCPSCETQLTTMGDYQRCVNCSSIWPRP